MSWLARVSFWRMLVLTVLVGWMSIGAGAHLTANDPLGKAIGLVKSQGSSCPCNFFAGLIDERFNCFC